MKRFSWYTIVHPDWNEGEPPLFRLVGPAILPDEHTCDIYYKPNRKGGHRHNHIRNAHKRMRKCHVCGEPIVTGCEVLGYRFSEFQCRSCRTEECREQACLVGLSFGGCEFETRRRRK